MAQHRRPKAVARQESFYQPSWLAALLALAVAVWLAWHGMARADGAVPDTAASETQDSADGVMPLDAPGEAVPNVGTPCSDEMDFSPDENYPDDFDADSIAWRAPGARILHAADGACRDVNPSRNA